MQRRKTPALSAILDQLKRSDSALSHEMLEQQLSGTVNRATIYRILNRLHEDALVHRVVTSEGVQHFALCVDCSTEHHQHLHLHFRCLDCGRVECLPQEVQPRVPAGYRIDDFNATVSGTCRRCSTTP